MLRFSFLKIGVRPLVCKRRGARHRWSRRFCRGTFFEVLTTVAGDGQRLSANVDRRSIGATAQPRPRHSHGHSTATAQPRPRHSHGTATAQPRHRSAHADTLVEGGSGEHVGKLLSKIGLCCRPSHLGLGQSRLEGPVLPTKSSSVLLCTCDTNTLLPPSNHTAVKLQIPIHACTCQSMPPQVCGRACAYASAHAYVPARMHRARHSSFFFTGGCRRASLHPRTAR